MQSLEGSENCLSTSKWMDYARLYRRKFNRVSAKQKRDFNLMMENIHNSIRDYELLLLEERRKPSKIKTSKLKDKEVQIKESIELLDQELMMSILLGK